MNMSLENIFSLSSGSESTLMDVQKSNKPSFRQCGHTMPSLFTSDMFLSVYGRRQVAGEQSGTNRIVVRGAAHCVLLGLVVHCLRFAASTNAATTLSKGIQKVSYAQRLFPYL